MGSNPNWIHPKHACYITVWDKHIHSISVKLSTFENVSQTGRFKGNTWVQWQQRWRENIVFLPKGVDKTVHPEKDIMNYLSCMQICKWQGCIEVADREKKQQHCNKRVAYGSGRLFVGNSYTWGNIYRWNCRGSRNLNWSLMLSSCNDKMKFWVWEFCSVFVWREKGK